MDQAYYLKETTASTNDTTEPGVTICEYTTVDACLKALAEAILFWEKEGYQGWKLSHKACNGAPFLMAEKTATAECVAIELEGFYSEFHKQFHFEERYLRHYAG